MNSYTTIKETISAEVVEKKSRFIAHAAPVRCEEEALAFLESIRTKHRMARHNVYAYILREGSRTRYSDDGEPQKTAGLPVLDTIKHAGLSDVIVVVTRYFGGTLLGTGGLVRAYSAAAQTALDNAEKVKVSNCVSLTLCIPYSLYDPLVRFVENRAAKVLSVDFSDEVQLELRTLAEEGETLLVDVQNLLRNQGSATMGKPYDAVF